ncbi:MAG: alpha/beta family hydrolase [Candidatus Sulfotelmatobacter sp.]
MPTIRAFTDDSADPRVRGYLHTPETPNNHALVLTHGAGSNAQAPLLIALADAFCAAGFTVLRCDLPYRQSRSYGPPGPADAARDRAGLKNAIAAVKNTLGAAENLGAPLKPGSGLSGNFPSSDPDQSQARSQIFLGGHSYGGRQSSMLCAELSETEPELVSGLLLLSYPLHPPRKPEQQRTQHLPNLHTPTLFVQGTRDPFATIAEIEQTLKMIPAKTKLLVIEGAGHDLGFKGKARQEELPALISSEFTEFFEPQS